MKTTFIALLCALSGFGHATAQTKTDTVKVQIKIKELRQKELTLKKQIETEDRKRNQRIEGVTEASMSIINIRQDSICLDLRSQLVDVQLQLNEIERSLKPVQTLTPEQAAANLHQGLSTISGESDSAPNKPTKPSKKQNKPSKKL